MSILIPQNSVATLLAHAEGVGAIAEFDLGLPQCLKTLIIRTTISVVTPATQLLPSAIAVTNTDQYLLYVRVEDVPLKYVGVEFSSSSGGTSSGLTIQQSDSIVTIPRYLHPNALITPIMPGAKSFNTWYLVNTSELSEDVPNSNKIVNGFLGRTVGYQTVSEPLPALTLEQYSLVHVMKNKAGNLQLVMREKQK